MHAEEESLIVDRILDAARGGFAVGIAQLTVVISSADADGRKGFKTGIPSSDATRSFRARTRQLAYRWAENVTLARLSAEDKSQVLTL